MSDPIKEFTDLKKSKSKKDKAKIKLAKKMGKRRGRPASDMLQTIKIQERFDKKQISIPIHSALTDEDVSIVISSILKGW